MSGKNTPFFLLLFKNKQDLAVFKRGWGITVIPGATSIPECRVLYLSEAFRGARIVNCDIEPTDGAPIFAYLRTGESSGID